MVIASPCCASSTGRSLAPAPGTRFAPSAEHSAGAPATNAREGRPSACARSPVERLAHSRHEGCLPGGDTRRETPPGRHPPVLVRRAPVALRPMSPRQAGGIYPRCMPSERLILLTGATGYVGGRLLHALEARGERVRCLSRRPEYLRATVADTTEVVRGRRPAAGDDRARARRRRHGLLPGALDELEPAVRRGRPERGPRLRSGGAGGRGAAAHLPRRARRVRGTVDPPRAPVRRSAGSCARPVCRRSSSAPRS